MGIYDREYYRREGPSFLGSFANRGMICKWLISINVIVFVFQLVTRRPGGPLEPQTSLLEQWFALKMDEVWSGQIWRLLTYAFLHDPGGIWHIAFNMLFLWWFGSDVEDIYGPWEFLAFYLVSAVAGGLVFSVQYFGEANASCIGASGAVTAAMVLYALHYPTRIIYLFMFLPVPIWLFVAFEVAQDLFGFMGGGPGGVAFSVHLAGAAFAFVYYKMHWRVLNFVPDLSAFRRQRVRPNLRVYREEEEASAPVPVATPAASSVDSDEQLEAKLDAVLEKVARFGQASLTEGERAILMRASEVYKRRRT